jgi:hypothetical protein
LDKNVGLPANSSGGHTRQLKPIKIINKAVALNSNEVQALQYPPLAGAGGGLDKIYC